MSFVSTRELTGSSVHNSSKEEVQYPFPYKNILFKRQFKNKILYSIMNSVFFFFFVSVNKMFLRKRGLVVPGAQGSSSLHKDPAKLRQPIRNCGHAPQFPQAQSPSLCFTSLLLSLDFSVAPDVKLSVFFCNSFMASSIRFSSS